MNVLFLTLVQFESLEERNIYSDLLREFRKHGHNIYVISPTEKRQGISNHLIQEDHASIFRLQIGNTQKTNFIEKGISTLLIEPLYKKAIKKYFSDVKFDLVLYSTPPITLVSSVNYIRKRDGAKTYLLLKDIFPQNAVDIGIIATSGLTGIFYRYFRWKEKKLYRISDRIGCMSPANVQYIKKHNPELNESIIEVCPNSIEVTEDVFTESERVQIRQKYNIPLDCKVFLFGGNLGKPQGIPSFLECLKMCRDLEEVLFLIVGSGTDTHLVDEYIREEQPRNVRMMNALPKENYEKLVRSCDVGLIVLDSRFTIPNFPSRMLSYMNAGIPVLAATDSNTDIGETVLEGQFGWWCKSNDPQMFYEIVKEILKSDLSAKGSNGLKYLKQYYSVEDTYYIIMNKGAQ